MIKVATSATTNRMICHMAVYDNIVITSNEQHNVDIFKKHNDDIYNKHDLTLINTIPTDIKTLLCSLMIDEYLYLACSKDLFRIDMESGEKTTIKMPSWLSCMMQLD